MAVYLCRWPNGEFSIVNARTRSDAIALLDELGNAEQAQVSLMRDCMFDFRLTDDGEIEMAEIGDATREPVMQKCYPVLNQAFTKAEHNAKGGHTKQGRKAILEAVKEERTRLWESQPEPKPAETELGREIQKQMDAPSVVVNRLVKAMAKRKLESKEGEEGEPN